MKKQYFKSSAKLAAVLAVLVMLWFLPLAIASDYPERPVTIVVPYGTGAGDFSARNLAAVAPDYLGQPVVVVNKSGADGITGSVSVMSAKADGYTLLLARVGSQAIGPALRPNIPYKWDDFTVIGMLDLQPYVCVVKTDSQYKSLNDLLEAIKKNPGRLKYSTAGATTIQALGPALLLDLAGIPYKSAVGIPFKGGGEAATAVIGGHVDFNCNLLSSVMANIQAGTLRALFVTTAERLKELPNVPTVNELGFKTMENLSGFSALYGPPKMDAKALERWKQTLQKVKHDKNWEQMTEKVGGISTIMTQEETYAYIKNQVELYENLGRKLGIREE